MNNITIERSHVYPGVLCVLEPYTPMKLSDAVEHVKQCKHGRLKMLCNLIEISKAHIKDAYHKEINNLVSQICPQYEYVDLKGNDQSSMIGFDHNVDKQKQSAEKLAIYIAVLTHDLPVKYQMSVYHYEFFQACSAFGYPEKHFEDILVNFFEKNILVEEVSA